MRAQEAAQAEAEAKEKAEKEKAEKAAAAKKAAADKPKPAPKPAPKAADPFADDYAALEGKTLKRTVSLEGGKSAVTRMDAAKAMRELDRRKAALEALQQCVRGAA